MEISAEAKAAIEAYRDRILAMPDIDVLARKELLQKARAGDPSAKAEVQVIAETTVLATAIDGLHLTFGIDFRPPHADKRVRHLLITAHKESVIEAIDFEDAWALAELFGFSKSARVTVGTNGLSLIVDIMEDMP